MPFARTWSEELIAEWLTLEGYFVEISAPIGVAKVGGRIEVDVLGCKIAKDVLEIIRVEVGVPGSIETFRKKFSEVNRKRAEHYCRQKLDHKGEIKYKEFYVATYVSKPLIAKAEKEGFEVKCIDSFVKDTKSKQDYPCKASEMYSASDLFGKAYFYAVKNYDFVAILSAKYGLLFPDDKIEPYDVTDG